MSGRTHPSSIPFALKRLCFKQFLEKQKGFLQERLYIDAELDKSMHCRFRQVHAGIQLWLEPAYLSIWYVGPRGIPEYGKMDCLAIFEWPDLDFQIGKYDSWQSKVAAGMRVPSDIQRAFIRDTFSAIEDWCQDRLQKQNCLVWFESPRQDPHTLVLQSSGVLIVARDSRTYRSLPRAHRLGNLFV